ncbi:MAG: copper amine oxidase N-terminal domain-containing protein [Clostridiales bacterium]|nr:copper amine oxidase N-terminal domain-containing protein [Clostridiales bacterium]
MKKLLLILAAITAAVSFTVSPYANEGYTEVTLVIDGQEVESDQPAVIVDGRTMVPVRVIADALGIWIDYIENTKTVLFEKNNTDIMLTIGNNFAVVDDEEVEIDSPAVIINGRTMVPVRFISEIFSAEVGWNADTKTVTITNIAVEAEPDDSDEPLYVDSELYYVAGRKRSESSSDSEHMIFADGVFVYEEYSHIDGKGSYGIYPGDTEPAAEILERSPYYGMTMEEIIASLEADGYEVVSGTDSSLLYY